MRHASPLRSSHFYPRPPRGGRRPSFPDQRGRRSISIHALREEGDLQTEVDNLTAELFLSTPSARRATHLPHADRQGREISIHALREEGDNFTKGTVIITSLFLSTPSARRATRARHAS